MLVTIRERVTRKGGARKGSPRERMAAKAERLPAGFVGLEWIEARDARCEEARKAAEADIARYKAECNAAREAQQQHYEAECRKSVVRKEKAPEKREQELVRVRTEAFGQVTEALELPTQYRKRRRTPAPERPATLEPIEVHYGVRR